MNDMITSAEAGRLIGVSEVMMHKWRAKGTGPAVYPGAGRSRYLYSRAECIAFARERMKPVDRIRELERRLDALAAPSETLQP